MKRLLVLILLLFTPVSLQAQENVSGTPAAQTAPAPARSANVPKFLQFLFPSLRETEASPSETLQAPFADGTREGEAAIDESKSLVPMHLAHRTKEDVSEWVVTTISEALSFDERDYNADLAQAKPSFDQGGWAQYQAFLTDKKFLNVLQSGQYDVRSYVKGVPYLLNEGAVSERYRWLYDVPVMVSYLKRGVSNYKGVEPVNQHMMLRVQIGRSEAAENEMGLLVERLEGRVQKAP